MTALELVRGAFATAFARQDVVSVSAWADAHARFRPEGSSSPIRWETSRTPYLREFMDSFAVPGVRQVTLKKAEQVGGTEALQRVVQEVIDQRPRPVFWIYPNDKVASRQVRLKLMPSLRATPRTRARFAGGKASQSATLLRFDRMSIMLAGSNSDANIEGFAAGLTIIDELDRCRPGTEEAVAGRGAAMAERLRGKVGTPGMAGEGIDASYQASDRRRYHVPCPFCGTYDHRRVEDLRWPGTLKDGRQSRYSRDLGADSAAVERDAFVVCRTCHGAIDHSHNLWQLGLGVWVPDGCAIAPLAYGLGRAPVVPAWSGTPRVRDHRGYELLGLYRSLPEGVNPYGALARDIVEAKGQPGKEWWNRRVGLAWSPSGESADARDVRAACVPVAAGGYRMGVAPPWMVAAIAGIDVQTDRAYIEVLGLGAGDEAGGQRCGLLWCEAVSVPMGLGMGAVDAALSRTFVRLAGPAVNGKEPDTGVVRVLASGMDSGHRADEVYQWAARGGLRKAVKGVGGGGSGAGHMNGLVRWSLIERDASNKPLPDGLRLLLVNTWAFKEMAVGQLRNVGREAEPGTLAGPMRLFLPEDTPAEWISHVTAEQIVTTRRGGRTRRGWALKPGRTENHYLDCHVYALALAHALGASQLRSGPPPRPHGPQVAKGALLRPGDRPASR